MKILLMFVVLISSLFSQTILCYKNNISDSTINMSIKLDGKECKGLSLDELKQNGWQIDDSRIIQNSALTYDHLYILKKDNPNSKFNSINKVAKKMIPKFDTSFKYAHIVDVSKNQIIINIGNLIVGQSGIVVHNYKNKDAIILASAIVQSSTSTQATLQLIENLNLEQPALPTSSLKVSVGDEVILNHLYNSSLLIVPNYEASKKIKSLYPKQNFLNPDVFAAFLKISNNPVPTQKDIQKFCKARDIGTIFISVEGKLYILDVNSFDTLKVSNLFLNDDSTQTPFFTKVEDIERNFWTFWDFKDDKIVDYNSFYLSLIEHTQYIPSEDENTTVIQKVSSGTKTLFKKLKDMLPW